GLAFFCRVGRYLLAGAHSARSQHVGERNAALLLQEIGYVVGALGAELLVHRRRSYRRRISLHLNHVTGDRLGLLAQFQELRFVLLIEGHLAVGEQDLHFAHDVVLTQFAEALVGVGDGCLVGGNLGLVSRLLLLLRGQSRLLLLDLGLLLR